jgi:lipopolysaccharide export system protein LptA
MRKITPFFIVIGIAFFGASASAAALGSADQPIEISSDTLDVDQNANQAIFSGNVIATQGTTKMRAARMVVHYRNEEKSAAKSAEGGAPGVSRIDAEGSVVFTTPEETAQGDRGIYNVATDTIELMGGSVTLTRDKNILKGSHLTYNMKTGRSNLTSGSGQVTASDGTKKTGRVRGLFVPKSDKPAAGQ